MNQQCRCTHPMHTPAVVTGGRYVVGPKPTYRGHPISWEYANPGETVTVRSIHSDYAYTHRDSGQSLSIDLTSLTPAPEPVAAPAVDDDQPDTDGPSESYQPPDDDDSLFRALTLLEKTKHERDEARESRQATLEEARQDWRVLNQVIDRHKRALDGAQGELNRARDAATRLGFDVMLGLRECLDLLARARDTAERERDEARATKDLHKERQQELEAALNTAERERDEARAELREERISIGLLNEEFQTVCEQRDELRVQVERLRAAQQLPDVPQVRIAERRGEYVYVDLGHNCGVYETRESAADAAALALAALRVFDAEAIGDALAGDAEFLQSQFGSILTDVDSTWGMVIRALDAHRARGGQEAGQ